MRLSVIVCLSLWVALLLGCATPGPPPRPTDSQASVIGVAVKIHAIVKIFSDPAQYAHFVRLDAEGNEEGEPILSNYSAGKYVYLVNAAPGRYAVVAAGFSKKMQTASTGNTTSLGGGATFTTSSSASMTNTTTAYLPKQLIEKTIVTVGAGQIAFVGELALNTSRDWDSGDAEQLRYYRLLAPGHEHKSFMAKVFSGLHHRGIEREIDQGDDAQNQFLAYSGDRFLGGGWDGVMLNPVASGPPEP